MAYTPSTTLTIPTGGTYTPSTTLTVTSGGAETYTLSGSISLIKFETYTLQGSINVNKVDAFTLSGTVNISKYETYTLSGSISLRVYEAVTLSGSIHINVEDKFFLRGTVGINVVDLTSSTYTLSGNVVINKVAPSALFGLVVINKVQPVDNAVLSGTVHIKVYETFTLRGKVEISVMPTLTGGPGGQGTGALVVLPPGASTRWQLKVIIDGEDYSSRIVGTASIDRERNSAVIATFSIRPFPGLVNPYLWIKKVVEITYLEHNSSGVLQVYTKLFTGIVDTPIFDSSSGLVEFTCTDDLQNVCMGSSHEYLAAITPLSTWSKYVYDENVDGWEYVQQRLETYPYSLGLNNNQAFFVSPWVSGHIDWEFNENSIMDSSLSVALANSGDIVNSVDVTMSAQYDVFREAVFNLQWEDQNWYTGHDLIWLFSDIQMICDSISSAGATFVGNPLFNVIPSSRVLLINGNNVNFLNDGSELLALEFRASVAKRYTQNTQNNMHTLVYSPESVTSLGALLSNVDGQIQVEYPKQLIDKFNATESVTKWALTAGIGLSEGFDSSLNFITEPQLFQGSGFVYYPKRPYTFTRFKQDSETGISFSSVNHVPLEMSGTYDFSFAAFGHPKQAGEHFYDLDQYATVGGVTERELLLSTLKAQAKTQIVESHRQNTVAFKSFIQPRIERGDMVRVNTSSLIASGLVSQITHELNVDSGLAESSIVVAVSSVKAIGLPGSTTEVYRLAGVIAINVRDIQGSGVGIRLAAPYSKAGINYHKVLPCHYHSGVGTVDDLWEGHITPADRTLNSGPNQFALLFPDLLEANTENATLETTLESQKIAIDQDELFLIST
jgi:hypothetical protein